MDSSRLADLKHQYRRAQGSVNYWNNAARSAQRAADKHEGTRRQDDLARVAEFTNKAIEAQQRLDAIKAQLTELDPQGARARQLAALRRAITRAHQEIARYKPLASLPGTQQAHWQQRLTGRQLKLQQLLDALTRHKKEDELNANRQLAKQDHNAAVNRAYSCTPISSAIEVLHHNLAQTNLQAIQQHRTAVIEALQTAIDEARRQGDQARADQLGHALAYQLELAEPGGTTTH